MDTETLVAAGGTELYSSFRPFDPVVDTETHCLVNQAPNRGRFRPFDPVVDTETLENQCIRIGKVLFSTLRSSRGY